MADAFYLGAYWGAREESLDACATRLAALVKSLAGLHEDLSTWYRKGESAETATGAVDLTGPEAAAMLSAGRQRKDIGGEVMAELGFRTSVWNGRTRPVELAVVCGAYPPNRPTANHVLMKFPATDAAPDLYDPALATGILKAIVDTFAPDWATFTSHSLRTAQGAKPGQLTVGWLTYLTQPVPALGFGSAEAYKSGTILTLGPSAADVAGAQVSQARTAVTMSL